MLSQTPTAISSRRHRAKLRALTPAKPRGRKTDYAKHARLVEAYERAQSTRRGNLHVLACDLGYANRASLANAYRWALKALGEGGSR